jgi:hypothetical protein
MTISRSALRKKSIAESSRPSRAARHSGRYTEPDTSDEEVLNDAADTADESPLAEASSWSQSARPTRSSKRTGDLVSDNDSIASPSKRQRTAEGSRPRRSRTNFVLGRGLPQKTSSVIIPILQSNVKAVPWEALPHFIWSQILTTAADSIEYESNPRAATYWLYNCCLVCRSLLDSAFTSLYASPVLHNAQVPKLIRTLELDDTSALANYGSRIHTLRVGASYVLAPNYATLFELTPQLKDIQVYQVSSGKWTRVGFSMLSTMRFAPLKEFFQGSSVRLETFRWASIDSASFQPEVVDLHRSSVLKDLRDISFMSWSPMQPSQIEVHKEVAIGTLNLLAKIQKVTFEDCSILDGTLFSRLEPLLSTLTIQNCPNIDSAMLGDFLTRRGQHLESLRLTSNRALSLEFLPVLYEHTPRLKILAVDMHYNSKLSSVSDVDPDFDFSLTTDTLPRWPPQLQEISFLHLRRWSLETAEGFFGSLIDSARYLTDLRKLTLTAILKVNWRDRAAFRDLWTELFKEVYECRSKPPNPNWRSIDAFYASKDLEITKTSEHSHGSSQLVDTTPTRRSVRLPRQNDGRSTFTSATLPKDRLDVVERLQRLRYQNRTGITRERAISVESDVSSEDEDDEQDTDSVKSDHIEVFIQGMCSLVDIRIDNQRPAETQFKEQDFMDDEKSGDEDWDGEDLEFD